ncbi:hypothetical protein JHS3_28400 [Jeongeupia sp. HS-3]|uniref:DUF3613 domain-containing protein n=1 Tax=Jeongeupia sp. HS-3 TaxID=1009682 RepID=UPI0018A39A96|nr:DUF3613 domain-containing protein [Jeongeupia sp. HS-3]BCL77104.1 hypothetical protein JHS3_28400 [Jeongeupia sp. HS-3]
MKRCCLFFLLALAGVAHAGDEPITDPDTPAKQRPYRVGDATRAWLALQVSGDAASLLPARSEEAVRAYQRYQKSFDTAISVTDVKDAKTSGTR